MRPCPAEKVETMDVTAANLENGLNINSNHGDVHLSVIKGSVEVHFSTDKGDFSAHQVNGDITAEGNCNDLTLSEITGKVTINGELFGDVHMENVNGLIHVHTSVTDMDVASLPGRISAGRGSICVSTSTSGPSSSRTASSNRVAVSCAFASGSVPSTSRSADTDRRPEIVWTAT